MALAEALLVDSIFASLAYLTITAATAVTSALRHGGRRIESVDDPRTLSVSRLTVPVSLLVPLNERCAAAATAATLNALLDLDYPEFEVIVVAEGLAPAMWDALKLTWTLEAKEFFFRQTLNTAPVQKIYRSARDPRLMVVDKAPAGRADTLNCGVNLARFRYVSAIDVGIAFDAGALLRAMSAPLRDPAAVVATSSHVEVRGREGDASGLRGWLQSLTSVRSLMESRLTWGTLDAGFGPADAVVVWRRDGVVQIGGFAAAASDPNLDMMLRLQTATTANVAGHVIRSAEVFGRIDSRSVAETSNAVARNQRAALHALMSWPRLADPARRALVYFAVSEILTPSVQAWVVLATAAGAVVGWWPWWDAVLAVALLSLTDAAASASALLVRGSVPGAPDARTLRQLLLTAPLEFVVSGTTAAWARGRGAWAFVTDLQTGTGHGP